MTSLCRRYRVTAAGFYAWRRRGESAHAKQDRMLLERIASLFAAHRQRYGSATAARAFTASCAKRGGL